MNGKCQCNAIPGDPHGCAKYDSTCSKIITDDFMCKITSNHANFDVPCGIFNCDNTDKKCGTDSQSGAVCKETCCDTQREFCKTNAKCLTDRGC